MRKGRGWTLAFHRSLYCVRPTVDFAGRHLQEYFISPSLPFREQKTGDSCCQPDGGRSSYSANSGFSHFPLVFLFFRFDTCQVEFSSESTFRMRSQNIFRSKLWDKETEHVNINEPNANYAKNSIESKYSASWKP